MSDKTTLKQLLESTRNSPSYKLWGVYFRLCHIEPELADEFEKHFNAVEDEHLKAIEEKDKDAALIVKIHDGSVKNLCSKINKLDAIIAKQAKEIERLKELTK